MPAKILIAHWNTMIIIMNDEVNDNNDTPPIQRKQNLQALHSVLCEMRSINSEEREIWIGTKKQSERGSQSKTGRQRAEVRVCGHCTVCAHGIQKRNYKKATSTNFNRDFNARILLDTKHSEISQTHKHIHTLIIHEREYNYDDDGDDDDTHE